MRSRKHEFSAAILILSFLSGSVAAESGGGEAPAAGVTVSKDQKEYIEKTGRLTSLSNRIVEHERHFWEIVHHKAATKDQAEKQRLIQALNTVAKDRNKDVETYNRILTDVKLRYPNQGVSLERRYNVVQKKSVEELEGLAGLDELLTRVKKVIDQKYAPFLIEEQGRNAGQPVVVKAPEEEKPTRLRLEK